MTAAPLTEVERYFTRADGSYVFARWGRPVVPVIFGLAEESLGTFKGAIEAVVALAGHRMAETDPEMGANLMIFFCRDWAELREVADLDGLLPDLPGLLDRLEARQANQYRRFRMEEDGAIRAGVVFLRMDAALEALPPEALALGQAVQALLLWSDTAFADRPPLEAVEGRAMLRAEVAKLIRAAYDPVLPRATRDPSHALRLAARMEVRG